MVESCLLKWGIDRLLTITVDNVSSNDVAIDYVKKKTKERDSSILGGEFMHMYCCARSEERRVGKECHLIKCAKKFHKGFVIFPIKIVRRTNGLFPISIRFIKIKFVMPILLFQPTKMPSQISKHNLT